MNDNPIYDPEKLATDKEQRELYEMAVLAKQALHHKKAQSVQGKAKHTEHRTFRTVAASLTALLLLGGIAYAAINVSLNRFFPSSPVLPDTTVVETVVTKTDTVVSVPADDSEEILFDNVTLEEMLTAVAKHYNLKCEFRDDVCRSIRIYYFFNKTKSVEKMIRDLNHFNKFEITKDDTTLYVQQKAKK